jgi:dihydrofolate reductase
MRKIIAFENISLDGFASGPGGEIDWAVHDDEVTQLGQEGHSSADLFLFGRKTYEMMAGFWPTPAGMTANKVFADIMNKTAKIVFSRTLEKAGWENTKIEREITEEKILALKQQTGKNIMIFGSISIVRQLLDFKMIDALQLMLNPVVLGKGKPMFDSEAEMSLALQSARTFTSGIVMLTYRPSW